MNNDIYGTVSTTTTASSTITTGSIAPYVSSSKTFAYSPAAVYQAEFDLYDHLFNPRRPELFDEVKDITLIKEKNGRERGVIIDFKNGNRQKAVCVGEDEFSLEIGITICLTKYLAEAYFHAKNGSATYNKAVEKCVKFLDKKDLKKYEEKEKEKRIKAAKAKRAEKKARREERKKNAAREEAIQIQVEAYTRAMHQLEEERQDRLFDDLK